MKILTTTLTVTVHLVTLDAQIAERAYSDILAPGEPGARPFTLPEGKFMIGDIVIIRGGRTDFAAKIVEIEDGKARLMNHVETPASLDESYSHDPNTFQRGRDDYKHGHKDSAVPSSREIGALEWLRGYLFQFSQSGDQTSKVGLVTDSISMLA